MTTPKRWIEHVALDNLPPALRNPNVHDIATIIQSIEQFGFVSPAIVDGRTGRLVAGHGRAEALRQMEAEGRPLPRGVQVKAGRWTIPVMAGWSSTDDAEAERYLIADNELTRRSRWDPSGLYDMLNELAGAGPDALLGTGFDSSALEQLAAQVTVPDFQPTPMGEQPRLDQQDPITCPECGHAFVPSR